MAITVEDVLELTRDDARAQWQRIVQRVPRKRQEPFLPVELVICYGLFMVLDPHRFGGSNIDDLPVVAKRLASIVRRPGSSLTAKMLNLDGSLPNGGRNEPAIFLALSENQGLFFELYERVLTAAREVGLDAQDVPDFLELLEVGHALPLLGRDLVSDERVGGYLDRYREKIAKVAKGTGLGELSVARIYAQRFGMEEHRFANEALVAHGRRCALTGLAPPGPMQHELLTVVRIQPDGADDDVANTLVASRLHARAFTQGWLAIDEDLRIQRAPALEQALSATKMDAFFGEPALLIRAALAAELVPRARPFLVAHRDNVFAQSA